MDRLLRPGMRLLRRFTVLGKFVTIALVLLFPLTLLAGASITGAADEVRGVGDERRGLAVARPLALLTADLCSWRIGRVTGRDRADLATSMRAVEEAEPALLRDLGLVFEWQRLRRTLLALDSVPPNLREAAGIGVTRDAVNLLDRVGTGSRLLHDAHPDAAYLAAVLVDHLPTLLDAAATAAENLPPDGRAPSDHDNLTRAVLSATRRLTSDLATAGSVTTWAALDSRLRDQSRSVQEAVTEFNTALAKGKPAFAADPSGRRLVSAAQDLSVALADVLDDLLLARGRDLAASSALPLLLALSAILIAAYLFAALARVTSHDARQVLAEINSLTTGALHQTRPLGGSDELAQMSRAAVVVRDHLTSLLGTLRYQATHDELTALGNRPLFVEKLTEALGQAGRRRVAVVVIDLNGFRDVNDSFGHGIGDRLLRTLGARFHRASRRRDLVARLGADQFGVLILDGAPEGALEGGLDGVDHRIAEEVATTLKTALEAPVDVDGRLLRVQVSVGIATAPEGGTTATELMRNADVAMHVAKSSPSRAVALFEPAMHEATRERTELSFDLVQAVERHQLGIVYQPIIDLASQTVHGVEALVRWEHPERGDIPPSVFVPLAEATGLIVPIGRWVMREAVGQLAMLRSEFPDAHPLTMDINLSTDQLNDGALVEDVLSLIGETGVDARSIVLEITESAFVRDFDTALRRLAQLDAMGVRLAIDDFGTGYSSLSYLGKLPATVLKIDKSFVRDVDGSTSSGSTSTAADNREVLLRGIVALGTSLGMQIVAEGIETAEQAQRLRDSGCQLGQGYLWSRPLTADDLRAVLHRGGHLQHLPRPRPAMDDPRLV